jgi:hemolysin activation/secretion protein
VFLPIVFPILPQIPTTSLVELPTPESIKVSQVKVEGSTLLTSQELRSIVSDIEGKTVTLEEIEKIADRITQRYLDHYAMTSRAILVKPILNGIVTIRVIEGSLEKIEVIGLSGLDPNYIRSRIGLATSPPLNLLKLEEQLRLLRGDPLISNVEASLKAGTNLGESILTVAATESQPFSGRLSVDNYSPPSVGGERVGINLSYKNINGFGDRANLAYYHTIGARTNNWDFTYESPANPMDGKLFTRIALGNQEIIQAPFDRFGFTGKSEIYELGFRQPLIRSLREELALSASINLNKSQTLVGGTGIPFTIGPDSQGMSRTTVLKLAKNYVSRDIMGSWSMGSQLNFGVGGFDATINPNGIPDSHFFSWQGQIQRLQLLNPDNLLIATTDIQLTTDPLLPLHQFTIGGGQSLRGYRQNIRSGDNGVKVSLENQMTIQRNAGGNSTLAIAPFVDLGWIWNHPNNPNQLPNQNFLAGVGLGTIWQPLPQLSLRVDYAIPLINLPDKSNHIQDQALYFNFTYQP